MIHASQAVPWLRDLGRDCHPPVTRFRVYAGDDPVTGKRIYRGETIRGTDRAAQRRAERALTRLLAEVDAQRAPTSTVTLAYVIGEWLRAAELEDTTRRTYVGYIDADDHPGARLGPGRQTDRLDARTLLRRAASLPGAL